MASHSFNLDDEAVRDLKRVQKKLKSRGKIPSASTAVRIALSFSSRNMQKVKL